MKTLNLFLAVIILLLFLSCEKDHSQSTEEMLFSIEELSLLNVAGAMSEALKEKEVQDFVLREALLQQNGEYEFLYALAKDKEVMDGVTFADVLERYDLENDGEYYYKEIVHTAPLLSIFVYMPEYGKLSSNTELDLKVFANTVEDDLNNDEMIPNFLNGSMSMQKSGIVPEFPTVVIKENERIITNMHESKLEAKLLGSTEGIEFLSIISGVAIPFDEKLHGQSHENDNVHSRTWQRELHPYKWDGVERILFKENLENWFTGGPELRINFQNLGDLQLTKPYNLSASQKNDWVLVDSKFFIWGQEPGIPDRVRYHFSESDGNADNGKFSISTPVKLLLPPFTVGVTPTYTFGDNQDDLYGECVEYYHEWVQLGGGWGNHDVVSGNFEAWMNIYE